MRSSREEPPPVCKPQQGSLPPRLGLGVNFWSDLDPASWLGRYQHQRTFRMDLIHSEVDIICEGMKLPSYVIRAFHGLIPFYINKGWMKKLMMFINRLEESTYDKYYGFLQMALVNLHQHKPAYMSYLLIIAGIEPNPGPQPRRTWAEKGKDKIDIVDDKKKKKIEKSISKAQRIPVQPKYVKKEVAKKDKAPNKKVSFKVSDMDFSKRYPVIGAAKTTDVMRPKVELITKEERAIMDKFSLDVSFTQNKPRVTGKETFTEFLHLWKANLPKPQPEKQPEPKPAPTFPKWHGKQITNFIAHYWFLPVIENGVVTSEARLQNQSVVNSALWRCIFHVYITVAVVLFFGGLIGSTVLVDNSVEVRYNNSAIIETPWNAFYEMLCDITVWEEKTFNYWYTRHNGTDYRPRVFEWTLPKFNFGLIKFDGCHNRHFNKMTSSKHTYHFKTKHEIVYKWMWNRNVVAMALACVMLLALLRNVEKRYIRYVIIDSGFTVDEVERNFSDTSRDPLETETLYAIIDIRVSCFLFFWGQQLSQIHPWWLPSFKAEAFVVPVRLVTSILANVNRLAARTEQEVQIAVDSAVRGLRGFSNLEYSLELSNLTGRVALTVMHLWRANQSNTHLNWVSELPQ